MFGAVPIITCANMYYFKTYLPFILFMLITNLFCITCINADYNVITFEGPGRIEQTPHRVLNIYCFQGKSKDIFHLWKSVQLEIEISTDNFLQYQGLTSEDVWKAYQLDRSSWTPNFFFSKKSRILRLDPFNNSCVAIKTDEYCAVRLIINNVDFFYVGLLVIGIFLFVYARLLGENVLFFYFTGISLGIFASFLILVYILSKMLPGKPIVYGAMIGGWTLGLYALQIIWSNFKPLIQTYLEYVIWYSVIMGFISFLICYKMGPPNDQRNKNLIMWTLQAIGLTFIYYSTYIIEVSLTIAITLLITKCIPQSLVDAIKKYWRLKYPPKQILLTEEEYYIQGQIETLKALEELRGYCSSPECPQWKLMLKLKDPKRFANFIQTNSHVSDEELSEYESSDFSLKRKNLSNKNNTKRKVHNIEKDDLISDDSSFSSEDY